eukprot:TRINITY_DN3596_c0_g1_i1.p1 TRINITY_DN3596_c0_g1~~TRINITY_DN3596_c0_g1_i1.p1  ORF type:complete len:389 (+),score=36.56 TRINITY_DN3596_c0_g1_i1:67-1233(+)
MEEKRMGFPSKRQASRGFDTEQLPSDVEASIVNWLEQGKRVFAKVHECVRQPWSQPHVNNHLAHELSSLREIMNSSVDLPTPPHCTGDMPFHKRRDTPSPTFLQDATVSLDSEALLNHPLWKSLHQGWPTVDPLKRLDATTDDHALPTVDPIIADIRENARKHQQIKGLIDLLLGAAARGETTEGVTQTKEDEDDCMVIEKPKDWAPRKCSSDAISGCEGNSGHAASEVPAMPLGKLGLKLSHSSVFEKLASQGRAQGSVCKCAFSQAHDAGGVGHGLRLDASIERATGSGPGHVEVTGDIVNGQHLGSLMGVPLSPLDLSLYGQGELTGPTQRAQHLEGMEVTVDDIDWENIDWGFLSSLKDDQTRKVQAPPVLEMPVVRSPHMGLM